MTGVLVYFCFYCEKKRRKRIAQELKSDEYDYIPDNNDEKIKQNMLLNDWFLMQTYYIL